MDEMTRISLLSYDDFTKEAAKLFRSWMQAVGRAKKDDARNALYAFLRLWHLDQPKRRTLAKSWLDSAFIEQGSA